MLDLTRRVVIRRERPHPCAQLRITDDDGNRITAFADQHPIGGPGSQLPDLDLRHGAGRAARTASGAPRTPALPTCRCTTSRRTASGAPW